MRARRSLLARVDDVTIWRVDGHAVRDLIDVEFTNGAHHAMAPYVPADEIWLDREARDAGGEWRFWMGFQLEHRRRMLAGATYLEALARAERGEIRARRAAAGVHGRVSRARLAALARRRVLGRADALRVVLVRGRVIRDLAYLHFTLGGHALRYPWIPADEIWIDDAVGPAERDVIVEHELVEWRLMATAGLGYDEAHARASAVERRSRARRRRHARRG